MSKWETVIQQLIWPKNQYNLQIDLKKIKETIVETLNQQYFKNILLVGVITVFAKAIGFFKESVIASKFGLSELLDTFFIAILIPSFINSVFIDSLKNIFIPNYIIELNTTKNRKSFQSTVVAIMLVIVIVLVLFNFIFVCFAFAFWDNYKNSSLSLQKFCNTIYLLKS